MSDYMITVYDSKPCDREYFDRVVEDTGIVS